ncbi:MAG: hypothetical protein IIX08_09615 [Bacteroidales bacterium]|jgi:hypothetical protein|nr:hypothetical protein [Bacteroidales bacterium]
MKKVLMLVAFFATMSLSAQSLREVEAIKKSDEYVCAEGVGKTLEEADQDAYNRLLKSSALVSHVSSYSTEQTMSTDGNTSSSQYSDNITIQSSLFIQNAKRYDYPPGRDGSYRVLRYIHKSDWEHRYDECKNRIKDNIEAALYNLELNNIEDALMYYTWAAALLKSYPHNDIEVEGVKVGVRQHCITAIRKILSDITVEVVDKKDNNQPNALFPCTYSLDFMYQGQPVQSLPFSYYNGRDWSEGASVKDGISAVDMRSAVNNFEIDIDCLQLDLARIEQSDVYTILTSPAGNLKFDEQVIKVKVDDAILGEKTGGIVISAESLQSAVTNSLKKSVEKHKPVESEIKDYSKFEGMMSSIVDGIEGQDTQSLRELFTEDGWDDFQKIVTEGNPSIIRKPEFRFLQMDSLLLCKSIPVRLKFKGNRAFVENVTFRINTNNDMIQSVAYTLSYGAEEHIMSMDWEDKGRLTLLTFLEDYRTAYCLRDIKYIENVFADDAYIIVGTQLKNSTVKASDGVVLNLPAETVRYQTKTKNEYITDLRRSFHSKEFVNIRFDECVADKGYNEKEGIYAVQVKQHYFSNNYADEGYLTLAIDMRDEDNPLVKVRVWQKDRNPEYTAETMIERTVSTGRGIY